MEENSQVQKLRKLVNEWVQHLQLWEKVDVEVIYKTKANIPHTDVLTNEYGITKEVLTYKEVKIPPSPYVKVTYHTPKGKWKKVLQPTGFESREFPLCDIERRIAHYRYKLRTVENNNEV